MKNFSKSWIDGTENVSKDAVKKHSKSEPHVRGIKLSKQENLQCLTMSVLEKSDVGRA